MSKSGQWNAGYPPTTERKEPLDELPVRDNFDSIPIGLLGVNWLPPPHLWSGGSTVKPDYYRVLGTSVAVLRSGGIHKMPGFGGIQQSARITADVSDIGALEHRFIRPGSFGRFPFLLGMQFSVLMPVLTSSVGVVRLYVSDGTNEAVSDPHSGSASGGPDGDGWELLVATLTINSPTPTASELKCRVEGPAGSVFWVDAGVAGIGPIPPAAWQPCPSIERAMVWPFAGPVTTGDGALEVEHTLSRPALAVERYQRVLTAPSGGPLTTQYQAGGVDMFSTDLSIGDGNTEASGGGVSGDYLTRCVGRRVPVTLDIDAVNDAEGLNAQLTLVHPWRPHEYLLDRDEVD